MLGPLRTLISVAFLALSLWAAFTIKLGRFTFAEHIDRIGQTDEAKELIDGTRSRISPGLEEVKQRMFGEYVEAPTHLAAPPSPVAAASPSRPEPRPRPVPVATATVSASTADAIKLPGRRKPAPARPTP